MPVKSIASLFCVAFFLVHANIVEVDDCASLESDEVCFLHRTPFDLASPPKRVNVFANLEALLRTHDSDFTFLFGDEHGIRFAHTQGTSRLGRLCEGIPAQCATKMATMLAMSEIVEQTDLDWKSHACEYFDFWTCDPNDWRSGIQLQHLLSFRSGLGEASCVYAYTTDSMKCVSLDICAKQIYDNGRYVDKAHANLWGVLPENSMPGKQRFYGESGFIVAQAMAMTAMRVDSWEELWSRAVGESSKMQEVQAEPEYGCPWMIGETIKVNKSFSTQGHDTYAWDSPCPGYVDGGSGMVASPAAFSRLLMRLVKNRKEHTELSRLDSWFRVPEFTNRHQWHTRPGYAGFLPAISWDTGHWALLSTYSMPRPSNKTCSSNSNYDAVAAFERTIPTLDETIKNLTNSLDQVPILAFEDVCETKANSVFPAGAARGGVPPDTSNIPISKHLFRVGYHAAT
mmetsp:Transcript_21171/g.56461  ORF Transcript_21171/g.56461 Transcript_21171/m.56461 type:complete len:456 (-) Transcript_21171:102-1469(-)|eukprot:CAMPEP_0194481516 /NCGR_PEP_ID=MMETSP0253-20130528/3902_1 /TAXON_ID=2966 /ORGANISM="Noctiluca scintillans" /LENGTH=455 /DNA_ID=CAMNT_0039321005 /DNA_START=54 /DNA_END=1421 /DNA_ORIENTATION=-